jgi:acylphosphatase
LFLVSGRVQGVGYRAFVRKHAVALGLAGYAKNLPDGRVEVAASGAPAAIGELAAHLRRGPPFSEVRSVEERETAPVGYHDFLIR